jgi:hypothetical protein
MQIMLYYVLDDIIMEILDFLLRAGAGCVLYSIQLGWFAHYMCRIEENRTVFFHSSFNPPPPPVVLLQKVKNEERSRSIQHNESY